MARPLLDDWYKVGYFADQVPGGSSEIGTLADTFTKNSENFAEMAELISRIADTGSDNTIWKGEAADKFVQEYSDFPSKIEKLSTGLKTVSSQLSSWADSVDLYQSQADTALYDALQAKEDKDKYTYLISQTSEAQQKVTSSLASLNADTSLHDSYVSYQKEIQGNALDTLNQQLADYQAKLSRAQGDLDEAKGRIDTAHTNFENAADDVANKISGAQETADLHVGFFEKMYYSSTWRKIVKAAEVIGFIAGLVGIALGGGGIIIAAILFATNIFSFVDSVAGMQVGENGLGDVVFNGIALGLSGYSAYKELANLSGEAKTAATALGRIDDGRVFIAGSDGIKVQKVTWGSFIKSNLKSYACSSILPGITKFQSNPYTGAIGEVVMRSKLELANIANSTAKNFYDFVREPGNGTFTDKVRNLTTQLVGSGWMKVVGEANKDFNGVKNIVKLATGK
ncbi:putative T7SS-secreted protein [Alloscardovia venturai]|uniref:T7SS-secreted protein n=1 Tax=Alloscardovia venturai TaxID=1769421 RepID=A0ABW2Y5P6_9BIFI